jgi:AbiTii
VPIGTLLRKCLVLQQQVKNEKFRAWLDRELDGYDQMEELPPYRVFNCVNKGLFIGGGAMLKDQPIPLEAATFSLLHMPRISLRWRTPPSQ